MKYQPLVRKGQLRASAMCFRRSDVPRSWREQLVQIFIYDDFIPQTVYNAARPVEWIHLPWHNETRSCHSFHQRTIKTNSSQRRQQLGQSHNVERQNKPVWFLFILDASTELILVVTFHTVNPTPTILLNVGASATHPLQMASPTYPAPKAKRRAGLCRMVHLKTMVMQ